eukprot:1433264-Amphidinium_carterae.1
MSRERESRSQAANAFWWENSARIQRTSTATPSEILFRRQPSETSGRMVLELWGGSGGTIFGP